MRIPKPYKFQLGVSFQYFEWGKTGQRLNPDEIDGYDWYKEVYDEDGNNIYDLFSDGTWAIREFDEYGR